MIIEQQNGNQSSEEYSKKWIEIQRDSLDKWENKIGLSKFNPPNSRDDALKFLEISSNDRSKMTCDECADAVITLAQYAAYVGRAAQREDSESLLLKEQINQLIGDLIPLQKAYSPEERKSLALLENENAQELERQRIAASVKSKRLFMYADRIDKVAKAYEVLSYARKRNRQYGE